MRRSYGGTVGWVSAAGGLLVALGAFGGWTQAGALEPVASGGLEVSYDDNINRAVWAAAKDGDWTIAPRVSAGTQAEAGLGMVAEGRVTAEARRHETYTLLDSVSPGATISLGRKFGLGREAPRVDLSLSGSRFLCRESLRDVTVVTPRLELSRWVHERVRASVGYEREDRVGGNSPVFETRNDTGFAGLSIDLASNVYLGLDYRYRSGDVVVSTKDYWIKGTEMAETEALGNDRYVNLLAATTQSGSVSVNWLCSERLSLSLAYERQETKSATAYAMADAGAMPVRFSYPNNVVRASVSFVF